MGSLFGKSKKQASRVTEQDKAVLQLKQQRDKLKQYQKNIMLNLEKERELARKLLKEGKKDRAKLLLKKKRYQEQILIRTDGQLENLETMANEVVFAQVELQVIEGLKVGNQALKKIHEVLTIENVEQILDETQEAIEKQREIDAVLSGTLTDEDEDAVLQELDDLIKESLPAVPADKIQQGVEAEENEEELALPEVPQTEPEKAKAKKQKTERVKVAAS